MEYGYCFTDIISTLNQRMANAEFRIILSMRSSVHLFDGSMLHSFGMGKTGVHAPKSYISDLHNMFALQSKTQNL